jgi:hypothetical protein
MKNPKILITRGECYFQMEVLYIKILGYQQRLEIYKFMSRKVRAVKQSA